MVAIAGDVQAVGNPVMMVRDPIFAGSFYPACGDECRSQLERMLDDAVVRENVQAASFAGGLVPHAGWSYSGPVSAAVFKQLSLRSCQQVIVLFGGVHRYRGRQAVMFGHGRWHTPLGPVDVDVRLAERILRNTDLIVEDPFAHEDEHSIEVQLPFIRHVFPKAAIVPIMVPGDPSAAEVGEAVARTVKAYNYDALIIGTTDLTHYGPRYQFQPKGVGPEANRWAREINDRRFVERVCQMRFGELVSEAKEHNNACSSGAAAATVAAVSALGAARGELLMQTSSSEVAASRGNEAAVDSVGYAGIVFY